MAANTVHWSDLPPQLWLEIGKRLHTFIDVLRFRSVCKLWRTSLSSFRVNSPLSPLDFPSPIISARFPTDALLFRSVIYRLSPLDHSQASHSTSSSPVSWFAKVETSKLGKLRLLHPLSKRYINFSDGDLPKELNFLDFRAIELAKSYTLRYSDGAFVRKITKVVMLPDSVWTDVRNCIAVAVYEEGKLGFARFGDEKWTLIDDRNFHYDDVIVYEGRFYAVDRWGTVFWIDSSMQLVQFYPYLCGFGNQKHLVEYGGELCVIDRFLNKERTIRNEEFHLFEVFDVPYEDSFSETVDFKVYRLDQEWGKWEELAGLGNQALFIGNDCCFSVSDPKFEGFKASCIYFTHETDDEATTRCRYGCSSHLFDVQEQRIWNVASVHDQTQIFRPPSSWLS